jgi:Zinc dependent phospholipase C
MKKPYKKQCYIKFLWCFPLVIFAADANAWGLYTHLFFSQWLMLSTPMLDPRIQAAIKKFPKLVLAGACLPDLAVVAKAFNSTHQWHKAEQMMQNAITDEEIAIAVGYSSHLFVDVVAHNHFVPAHEAKWAHIDLLNKNVVAHITSEWAMDAHLDKQVTHCPHHLILSNLNALSEFIAPYFDVSTQHAKHKLRFLAWADGLLRVTQLSSMMLWTLKLSDSGFVKNCDYYVTKTSHALASFEQSLQGIRPNWQPELNHFSAAEMLVWREQCLRDLSIRLATPIHYYAAEIN